MKKKLRLFIKNIYRRRAWRRLVSISSCIVVFVTTYALLLPAITMGKMADCGLEEHQHSDECYREYLICGLEESKGHQHSDSCYTIDRHLICTAEEHTHDQDCYDAEGNLTCALEEHSHSEECYREDRILSCQKEETEGHCHDASCYEKVLVCEKEVHTHSAACFNKNETNNQNEINDGIKKETAETIGFARMLTDATSLYTLAGDEEDAAWIRTDEKEAAEIGAGDTVRLYYAYTIPAGTLQEENAVIRYALPANVRLRDEQIEEVNAMNKGRGAQAVEGARTPDLDSSGEEFVSAWIQFENIYDDVNDKDPVLKEQDIVLTFDKYSIEKNRKTCDENGNLLSRGEEIRGFFCVDVTADQIQFEQNEDKTEARITLVEEDSELGVDRIRRTLQLVEKKENSDKAETAADESEALNESAALDETEAAEEKTENPEKEDIEGKEAQEKTLTYNGSDYTVNVSYKEDADIPEDARLTVKEIKSTSSVYDEYVSRTEDALGVEEGSTEYIRLFDIKIIDHAGEKIQPAEGTSVDVQIELADRNSENLNVVHFADESEEGVVVENSTENIENGSAVEFATDGFSVYSIVEAPEPIPGIGWTKITSVDEIRELGASGLYPGNPGGYYFTNQITQINNTRTGITKTSQIDNPGMSANAVKYYFEPVDGQGNQFRAYCYGDDNEKKYVRQNSNSLSLENEQNATTFTIEVFSEQEHTFRVRGANNFCWNMQGGTNGKSLAAYNVTSDVNAKIIFQYYNSPEKDPYDLDGKTYGIVCSDGQMYCTASIAEETGNGGLKVMDLPVLDTVDRTQILFLSQDSDATEWTFHSVTADQYYITTEVGGSTKYLTINGTNTVLLDSPDSTNSLITVTPGSGQNAGKYSFKVGNHVLGLSGTGDDRQFDAEGGSGSKVWLNLAEKTTLSEDDYLIYTAHKVSVSDTVNVKDGDQIILYTRSWNETTKKYEYYAVDHDGSLIRVYESGDVIQWIGSQINTALWNFTEYHYEGTSDPNYYYDLQNDYSGKYIAPQITGSQTLSDSPIGINLNGRRYGDNYSNIIAWDDPYYEYTGLKIEDGHVVSCPMAEAEDFYFAVMHPTSVQQLTTVDTVDNDAHGITMKMVDFNNVVDYGNNTKRDEDQTDILGLDTNTKGLVSTDLKSDGYPVTVEEKTGQHPKSLAELFEGGTKVNQLFIQSTYNENGYFEYDSTQNFAHLNEDGTFTVYDQLAAIGTATGPTRTHGQFMPYNNISADKVAAVTNQTNVLAEKLPDSDPRKGERLYLIPNNDADYFFGMEMEASFTQSVSGLDDWGHDLIFEFSGDDDFWLYVDGELVLDLGGVHSASTGTINFRTGEVYYMRKNANNTHQSTTSTTLREVFKNNYIARKPSATDDEVNEYLNGIFVLNENGQYVFKDYSPHKMKMLYMERGAGASNLHMRFNLASVKPGTVVLKKTISGTDKEDYTLAEFPYQIWYKTSEQGAFECLTNTTAHTSVNHAGKMIPVKYAAAYTPPGGTEEYNDVFFLKPGQSADIRLPEETLQYYIVECGINSNIYDAVKVNGDNPDEIISRDAPRKDYKIHAATITERPRVTYDNHVNENALRTLTITKKLYDAEGNPITDDLTGFSFRLSLGTENDDTLTLANMHDYHVRDASGNYCKWVSGSGFVSLGKSQWSLLTDDEKAKATFTTSPNGSISKIPAEYKVEVRQLVVGSKFKVEEYPSEIPAGYAFWKYEREGGSYISGEDKNFGTIRDNSDPAIDVCNKRGWGLTVNKVWSDAEFMTSHDPIYFAVYAGDELVEGSVRQMANGTLSRYWYFENLKSGTGFSDYKIREVIPTGSFSVDTNGKVTEYDSVMAIEEGGTLMIGGTPEIGGEGSFSYKVSYQPGQPGGGNQNVRTDIVRNTRRGLKILKTDLDATPLEGAVFTLTDAATQRTIGADKFISDADGLVTIAYLPNGNYILEETETPFAHLKLAEQINITVSNGEISIPPAQNDEYTFTTPEGDMPTLTVKNRKMKLQVKKVDAKGSKLASAHFAIYRQVETATGDLIMDYQPYSGYEDLVSDDQGIAADDLQMLPRGTYYLVETEAPESYKGLENPVLFTIGKDGDVTLAEGTDPSVTLEREENKDATVLTIRVENGISAKKIRFKKVNIENPTGSALQGARFDLYGTTDGVRNPEALYTNMISNEDGFLTVGGINEFDLGLGTYHLVETEAPSGYIKRSDAVIVTVSAVGVTYDDGTTFSSSGTGMLADGDAVILLITNSSGYELPAAGGCGTSRFYLLGGLLLILAAGALTLSKKEL